MYAAIKFVRDELNVHLNRIFQTESDSVVIGKVHEPDGTVSPGITDKIVISLVNTERTAINGRTLVSRNSANPIPQDRSAPLNMSLHILVASTFKDYSVALKYLSHTAEFFRSRGEITQNSFAPLPDGIEKLDLLPENTSTIELSNLWGMMGGNHYPSLQYKLRMIALDSSAVREMPGIRQPAVAIER